MVFSAGQVCFALSLSTTHYYTPVCSYATMHATPLRRLVNTDLPTIPVFSMCTHGHHLYPRSNVILLGHNALPLLHTLVPEIPVVLTNCLYLYLVLSTRWLLSIMGRVGRIMLYFLPIMLFQNAQNSTDYALNYAPKLPIMLKLCSLFLGGANLYVQITALLCYVHHNFITHLKPGLVAAIPWRLYHWARSPGMRTRYLGHS